MLAYTLVVYVYEEVRLFLEGGSVSCGRDDAWGLYRVILCVWRIERGVDMSLMSATEREFVVKQFRECTEKK